MCGIVGFSGRFDPASLESGVAAIRHRGPDDFGIFLDPASEIGLGHARLSIIDLSAAGHQPMAALDGAVQVVFNGEIYNFRELRTELEGKGHAFRSNSDTEVLLRLYVEEGEACLSRLDGIFAFAIFDRRTRSTLVARDALGVKPLYFATTSRGVAWCSEVKGLLGLVPEAREIDLVALHRYLSFLWCPGEGTPLRDVRKLGPGEALVVRDGRILRRWAWYRLPVARGVKADLDARASVEGTASHVRAAVRRQMVSDVPLGAFLSGGLDSSAVVAFAREATPDLRCFTIDVRGGSEEGTTDDLPYAREVARHLGVRLEVVEVDAGRMAAGLERMVEQLDEPLADPAPLNVLFISELARSHGIEVLLAGTGGDDLFTGYRRHRALDLERWWDWLPVSVRKGIERGGETLDRRRPWARRLAKLASGAALEGDDRIVNYFRWATEASLFALYRPSVRHDIGRGDAAEPMLEFLRGLPLGTPRLERMLALEQRFFLPDHNLAYTDKMSMAVGVEVRVPLLDAALVEFAARIPPSIKQRGGIGKWVFKEAMRPYLPSHVIDRPKSGFGAPLRRWIRHELKPMVADLLGPASLSRRGIFDPAAVAALIAANEAGAVDASYTILSLLCIETWCRRFIDGPAPVARLTA